LLSRTRHAFIVLYPHHICWHTEIEFIEFIRLLGLHNFNFLFFLSRKLWLRRNGG
jgi:hypothetical protein